MINSSKHFLPIALLGTLFSTNLLADKIDFNRDIRPIFNRSCIAVLVGNHQWREQNGFAAQIDTSKLLVQLGLKPDDIYSKAPLSADHEERYQRFLDRNTDVLIIFKFNFSN